MRKVLRLPRKSSRSKQQCESEMSVCEMNVCEINVCEMSVRDEVCEMSV